MSYILCVPYCFASSLLVFHLSEPKTKWLCLDSQGCCLHVCRCVHSVFSSQLSSCYPRNDHRRLDFLCFHLVPPSFCHFLKKQGVLACARLCICVRAQRQRSSSWWQWCYGTNISVAKSVSNNIFALYFGYSY